MKLQPAAMIDLDNNVTKIERMNLLSGVYNELWLQDLLASNPYLLPVNSFGPIYDNLICIGREAPAAGAGYIDCLFVSPAGGIVVVETKLFRNQEARRTVVAQIIEYAKAIRSWDCETLDSIAEDYSYKTSGQSFRVIDMMAQNDLLTYGDESGFVDAVNSNLSAGRILLLIVGDGIHSGVQELADFINASSGNTFELALAEIEIYQSSSCVFVVPRILTKTETIERRVYRISDGKPDKPLSETGFINRFAENGGYDPDQVIEFVYSISAVDGISIRVSPAELSLRFSLGGSDYALLSLSIQNDHADIYFMPYWIGQFIDKHGSRSALAKSFFDFLLPYIDDSRCRKPPYEHTGSYFLNVQDALEHTVSFVSAVNDYIHAITE